MDRVKKRTVFGLNLRRLIKGLGLSQGKFAEGVFVSQPAVAGWIRGNPPPHPSMVRMVCDVFGLSIGSLFEERDGLVLNSVERVLQAKLLSVPFVERGIMCLCARQRAARRRRRKK